MPIFTFMGASLLRQDSLYSFQIITKTIDTIIPPLIKVCFKWNLTLKLFFVFVCWEVQVLVSLLFIVCFMSCLLFLQSVSAQPPAKRRASRHGSKATPLSVEGVVSQILRTFVDAVGHMPEHRRLLLFSRLVETVGAGDCLHMALGLLVEKQLLQQPDTNSQVCTYCFC